MAKGRKTGGRTKGTPNKDNPLKGFIKANSTEYFTEPVKGDKQKRTAFEIDREQLPPAERIQVQLKLLNKVVPDMKAIDANLSTNNVHITIEDRLRQLCGEDNDGDE